MDNWYKNFEDKVVEEVKDCNAKDIAFFRIEEYLRNAERMSQNSKCCDKCNSFINQMNEELVNIKIAIDKPGAERKKFDYIQNKSIEHLKKEHGYYPAQYFRYTYTLYWLIAFSFIALIFSKIFTNIDSVVFYSPAFVIGITTGQIIGGRKDNKIIRNKKQL